MRPRGRGARVLSDLSDLLVFVFDFPLYILMANSFVSHMYAFIHLRREKVIPVFVIWRLHYSVLLHMCCCPYVPRFEF
jgi:hypothetical protein